MGGSDSLSMRMTEIGQKCFWAFGRDFVWSIVVERVFSCACLIAGMFALGILFITRVGRLHEISDCHDDDATLLTVYKVLVMNDEAWSSSRDLHVTDTHPYFTALPITSRTDTTNTGGHKASGIECWASNTILYHPLR